MLNRVVQVSSLAIVILSAGRIGFFLLMMGAWLPEVPGSLHLLDIAALAVFVSVAVHRSYPYALVLSACSLFAATFYLYVTADGSVAPRPRFWQGNREAVICLIAAIVFSVAAWSGNRKKSLVMWQGTQA